MARLRIRYTACRPGLILTDTPRPNCWACQGDGGHYRDYGHHEDGEYADTEWESCPCWDETRCRTLLPLPRITRRARRARRARGTFPDPWASNGHSGEPPF